ncbi:hypothetical protein REJC140_04010 [Pseudorhizobium endolithicum]|uniref:Uncharacterized protein n=1 Tax=Pseudorhizobium endolithicum TaxID=1191678 RepID=A0ABN7JXQ1_9HYPH|nr:hypothetical protein REJC140_04010 [Pseudorhizobium endolithicum]
MPRFLAVYTMKPEDLAAFRSLPKPEQDAVDAAGVKQWAAWEDRNAGRSSTAAAWSAGRRG